MSTIEKHFTPAERKQYRDADDNARYYQRKMREAQALVRRLKNRARKRATTAKEGTA